MKNKAFKIVMSSGDPIEIDADELNGILHGINQGSVVVCRRGIFNPSFYVSIIEDRNRTESFREELHLLHDEKLEQKKLEGPEKLKNLFEDIKQLSEIKKING